ncbi:hypothetical protein DPMN_005485 [Dreissena polymorpha]|uniref:Uncharacterized protein n=1 Tax=Dreissena polymorpha TaxID=45954 RepID=A0A9D4MTM8_DREPO|nr:hypothetical protein DPMN_005485 [Dreissena polymorpha]
MFGTQMIEARLKLLFGFQSLRAVSEYANSMPPNVHGNILGSDVEAIEPLARNR